MNIPDDPPTGPAGIAVAELDAALGALARLPRATPWAHARKPCERVAAAELAVSRATACTECGAGIGEDCDLYCPDAPRGLEEIAAGFYGLGT